MTKPRRKVKGAMDGERGRIVECGDKLLSRYAPIPGMLTALLAKLDPDGYTVLLDEFRQEYQPVGLEVRMVEYIAQMAYSVRGCITLESEILNMTMKTGALPGETTEDALLRAYIADLTGPKLLDKLGGYRQRLQREFSRGVRILRGRASLRQIRDDRAAAELMSRKTCTSVIQ